MVAAAARPARAGRRRACAGLARRRAGLVLLAACWLWVAWAWQLQRYATINWAATYFAWLWGVQAVLLLGAAAFTRLGTAPHPLRIDGLVIVAFALVGYPLMAVVFGGGWAEAQVFGMAPDPTALATLGVLRVLRLPAWTYGVPLVWCGVAGATLWAMDLPVFWIMPATVVWAIAAACLRRSRA